jgi:hypothetical protein
MSVTMFFIVTHTIITSYSAVGIFIIVRAAIRGLPPVDCSFVTISYIATKAETVQLAAVTIFLIVTAMIFVFF